MEIVRDKEFVQFFSYNARNFAFEEENGTPEQKVQIQINVIPDVPEYSEENTVLGASVEFVILLDNFIVSGYVMQNNVIQNRKVNEGNELTQEEMDEIARPLLNMITRLTREVSEVALDEPGVNLKF
ncbi:hypothetical protein BG261_00140 [Floricoccus tropicus]|uniref:Uncharacterized protein n=1 Tax=Floricoccus tropicus TaxID=1859473 RepID=A0A1E8GQ13_9LACT|nr:DUF1149 family protein [Floricoccus tropicus]OFI50332.1 hypothetical protein BG261_00140 [Floricoccus tropicus]